MHGMLSLGPIFAKRHEEQRTSFSVRFADRAFVVGIECGCCVEPSTAARRCGRVESLNPFTNGNTDNDDDNVFVFSPGDASAVTLALFVRAWETVADANSTDGDDEGDLMDVTVAERASISSMGSLVAFRVVGIFDFDSSRVLVVVLVLEPSGWFVPFPAVR
jgi:hypothetical protein